MSVGVTAQNTQELDLSYGEEVELNEYTFRYDDQDGTRYFEVTVERDGSTFLVEQQTQDELYDLEKPHTFDISDELDIELKEMTSDKNGVGLNLSLKASENIFADADMSTSAPDRVFVGQSEEVDIPLTLENTGIVNQTFSLGAVHNTSAEVSYNFQDFNVTKLKVDNGKEESISAKIDVPETAKKGTYHFELYAEDKSRVSENITVEIRESSDASERRRISLDAEESFIGVKPGEEKQIPVRVRNRGTVTIDNIEVDVEAPEGWETELTQSSSPSLEQYDSFRTMVTVKAPVNAQPGDNFVEVSASSDETATEEPERVRVEVQQESNLRYIGLGIMGFSLVLLIVVYRRLGRR
ncbi:membrane protein [Candidatus Nanohalobium constans]|uniref:Membrane protein n=2 Tax=Candidatus Nanohalobium constans TaxID=2565781 RepID=A0A5Q0UGE1_9ARCH|nr:membrane protein [Candidatus Nanohalobium constans]